MAKNLGKRHKPHESAQKSKGIFSSKEYEEDKKQEDSEAIDLMKQNQEQAPARQYIFSNLQPSPNVIDVDFQFVNPQQPFFQIVANSFLQNYIQPTYENAFAPFNTGDMADAIISQISIGTFIINGTKQSAGYSSTTSTTSPQSNQQQKQKTGEQEQDHDIYAFATFLNIEKLQKQEFMIKVAEYISTNSAKCLNQQENDNFMILLSNHRIGLLVSERMLNLPFQLVPMLYQNLLEDLRWTLQQPDVQNPKSYMFEYILVITRGYQYVNESIQGPNKKKKMTQSSAVNFYKVQDEILIEKAITSFQFRVKTKMPVEDDEAKIQNYKVMYILSFKDFKQAVQQIKT